jgi:hypothetical protein
MVMAAVSGVWCVWRAGRPLQVRQNSGRGACGYGSSQRVGGVEGVPSPTAAPGHGAGYGRSQHRHLQCICQPLAGAAVQRRGHQRCCGAAARAPAVMAGQNLLQQSQERRRGCLRRACQFLSASAVAAAAAWLERATATAAAAAAAARYQQQPRAPLLPSVGNIKGGKLAQRNKETKAKLHPGGKTKPKKILRETSCSKEFLQKGPCS